MTLVVSLRVPDGVVLAADSLQTTQGTIIPGIKDFAIKHPKTQEEIKLGDLNLPPISIPTSTSSYAQKLFPFKNKYGVASFGSAIINNRTIYNHIKNLESSTNDVNSVSEAAELIKDYFDKQLQEEVANKSTTIPNNAFAVGFQIVGYESKDDISGRTIEVAIGSKSNTKNLDGIGCTVSGDTLVVRKMWELGQHEGSQTNYGAFSLKDAVDYCEYLINTTSTFQRFANMIPTVGGEVDIALITNYSNFTWIKYKELTKVLEKF